MAVKESIRHFLGNKYFDLSESEKDRIEKIQKKYFQSNFALLESYGVSAEKIGRFNGYTSWGGGGETVNSDPGGYRWSYSVDSASGSQTQANSLQVSLNINDYGMWNGDVWWVESVHARIYYTVPNRYDLECTATWAAPSADFVSIDLIEWQYIQSVDGGTDMVMYAKNWVSGLCNVTKIASDHRKYLNHIRRASGIMALGYDGCKHCLPELHTK